VKQPSQKSKSRIVKGRLKQTAVIKEERWTSGGRIVSKEDIYQLEGSSLVKRVSKRKTQAESSHQKREMD
jgi:hypothetical protein